MMRKIRTPVELLDLATAAEAVNPKGFRSAPTGKHKKGRKHTKPPLTVKLADAVFGKEK